MVRPLSMLFDPVRDSAFYSFATLATIFYTSQSTLSEKIMSKYNEFITNLRDGHYDDNLESIRMLVTNRREKLAQLEGSAMVPGSHVIICGDIRPVYLVGHIAKVTKVNQSTVSISFLKPIYGTGGRTRPIVDCRVPVTCVQLAPQKNVDEYIQKHAKAVGPTAMRQNRWNGPNMVNDAEEAAIARAEPRGS